MKKKYAAFLIPVYGPAGQMPVVQAWEKTSGLFSCAEKGDGLYTEVELTSWATEVGKSLILMKIEEDYPDTKE
jgi:hypothetical protein